MLEFTIHTVFSVDNGKYEYKIVCQEYPGVKGYGETEDLALLNFHRNMAKYYEKKIKDSTQYDGELTEGSVCVYVKSGNLVTLLKKHDDGNCTVQRVSNPDKTLIVPISGLSPVLPSGVEQ